MISLLHLMNILREITLDFRIICLQRPRGRQGIHSGKLFIEGHVREHTTRRRLIETKDHYTKPGLRPHGQVKLGASKASESRHCQILGFGVDGKGGTAGTVGTGREHLIL
jgi:hypothetical protein